jgi:hypothetical protein
MKAKYTGLEVFHLVNVLRECDSKVGQARQFIGINTKRFAAPYAECLSWLGDYDEEYDELTVQRAQDGSVAGFSFDTSASLDGLNAFMAEISGREYEVEPYAMADDVLYLIDNISIGQEEILRHLTVERVEARVKAQQEADEE